MVKLQLHCQNKFLFFSFFLQNPVRFLWGRGGLESHDWTWWRKIFLYLDIDINLFVIVFNLWYNLYFLILMNSVIDIFYCCDCSPKNIHAVCLENAATLPVPSCLTLRHTLRCRLRCLSVLKVTLCIFHALKKRVFLCVLHYVWCLDLK